MDEILLEVKDFNVTLDDSQIISNLNFNVLEGEFLTIMGPNGSGKTVLVKSLLGLIPHEGELRWHKQPKIGYLPQGLNQMAVKDFPLTVHDFFALKKIKRDDILRHLDLVGLKQNILDKPAGFLSGGEFQRMLIAWVLSTEPNILFLDEPTTAIDVAGGKTIFTLFKNIWQEKKITILNVTHDLNVVYAYSTHVLCLSRFGHCCYGAPKEILTPEVMRDIYGTDIKFYTHTPSSKF